jgi:hypothetical protein
MEEPSTRRCLLFCFERPGKMSGRVLGNGVNRVGRDVGIAGCCDRLRVSEHGADHGQRVSSVDRHGGESMTQVMDAPAFQGLLMRFPGGFLLFGHAEKRPKTRAP